MYYCSDYTVAVYLCVVTMFCWGSWGNTQKLAGKTWRYVSPLVNRAIDELRLQHRRTIFEIVLRTDARKCGIIWA